MTKKVYFNGIDGATGKYFQPPMPLDRFVDAIRDHRPAVVPVARAEEAGVDPLDLASAGWGAVFSDRADPAVREALRPLLEHRRGQAARVEEGRYRELTYRRGETKRRFLPRHGASFGPVDPDRVPYYLLLVGGPEEIPFSFQYGLDVQYAVGRLALDTPEDYARYAASVVEHERRAHEGGAPVQRRAAFFGVENPNDPATRVSVEDLVIPLARELEADDDGWRIDTVLRADATKARLAELIGGGNGEDRPAFLFTAGHAALFANGHPRQLAEQGALVCADWPGPGGGGLLPEHLFGAGDLHADARLGGLVTFHFGCFTAGTPRHDSFKLTSPDEPRPIAPHPFVAGLSRRLLGHPGGGTLAVIGHVDRAWMHSFRWAGAGSQVQVFASTARKILRGDPVGHALEDFGVRYAELSTELNALRWERFESGDDVDEEEQAGLWQAFQDARGYALLGDPAVRLRTAASDPETPDRGDRS